MSVRARHAMTDWDGTIVNRTTWDVVLDGQIDYPVTDDEGYSVLDDVKLEMPMSAMVWYNTKVLFLRRRFANKWFLELQR